MFSPSALELIRKGFSEGRKPQTAALSGFKTINEHV